MAQLRRMFMLDGDEPVEVFDAVAWADYMAEADRDILFTAVHTPVRVIEVTTFFIGGDVYKDDMGPFLFVTRTDWQGLIRPRYTNDRSAAEAAHAEMVATLQRRR